VQTIEAAKGAKDDLAAFQGLRIHVVKVRQVRPVLGLPVHGNGMGAVHSGTVCCRSQVWENGQTTHEKDKP
jgi:hypothetical protein